MIVRAASRRCREKAEKPSPINGLSPRSVTQDGLEHGRA
jgi:hypothetical protein